MDRQTRPDEIDALIDMIDGTMGNDVSRLSVQFSEKVAEGDKVKSSHHGRCDIGSPWADGSVSKCDIIEPVDEE
ncbi:MAG: hypothetical protein ILP19_06575 [Oscillospiraceae bacterium]|nr:hypothetical protein [Oscillospiraceae bacterium]